MPRQHSDSQEFSRFVEADSVGSEESARTVALLARRVAEGDGQTAGLVRAMEDSRRRVSAAEAQVAALQAAGVFTALKAGVLLIVVHCASPSDG